MSKSYCWFVAVRSQSGAVCEVFEFDRRRAAEKFAAAARKKWGFETAISRKEKQPCPQK